MIRDQAPAPLRLSTKRVLVTGGAGFLGSHLVDRLIARGDEVLCVDSLVTGSLDNIRHLLGHARFEFMRHDVCVPLQVEVDEIYNFACPASPVHYQRDPVHTTRTAVIGAINMLDLAKRLKCRIFQASTSEVYGDPAVHPQNEAYWGNVNPVGPRACYDEGKRCAETLFFDYRRQFGVEIKVARFFNTYGPRMQPGDGRVVSNFLLQALSGEPITLHGDGRQSRSFCYVDDLIDGVLQLMESPSELVGPVNLGFPRETSIRALADLVLELTGSSSPLVLLPLPEDDPIRRQPDVGFAQRQLGWSPRVSLKEGLERTMAYYVEAQAGMATGCREARVAGRMPARSFPRLA